MLAQSLARRRERHLPGRAIEQRDIEFSDVVKDAFPLMHEAVQLIERGCDGETAVRILL